MHQYERTIMAFDDAGNEYFIDIFSSVKNINNLHHEGAVQNGLSSYKTREGHAVTHLGGGDFSVWVKGEEDAVHVKTTDSEFA
ncbi:hypothetical protein VRRI112168_18475 [Vreelandella rituensis]|uniref:Uncharacterized protein n=1 Tax=Vreelandella rituensis TaxID=2282306 RepID=A0A368TTH4_9GAMM|nr:hypothetical protein [Halomonas rituensis]RCV87908.1 hypothetical protein DU506_15930 [Halomonas rituensis]